ncbi:MAG: helix-turn-helix transcriptional regulator [Phycisphaeraceae bacterium]|nr:helix-turn-helix transcriptional regulator [Phycisphaeraceae bacterium]
MKSDDMDSIFHALAHATRRAILDHLAGHPGATVSGVAARFESSRIAVMKHLRVLEDAGLVHSQKAGRERRLFFNVVPIQLIYDRWTDRYSSFWAGRMADIKDRIESRVSRKAADCA